MTDFEPNLETSPLPKIPLPKGWSDLTLMALLHVISLARLAIMNTRNWPDSECDGLQLRADLTLVPTDHGFWLPTSQSEFENELSLWATWYNSHRSHMALRGRTPDEVYYRKRAACTLPRIEALKSMCQTKKYDGGQGRAKSQCEAHVSRRAKTSAYLASSTRVISLYQIVKDRKISQQTAMKVCADLIGDHLFHVFCCFIPRK